MQTVPSLIGTGAAIAAAASGLVFGQPTDSSAPTTRPASRSHRTKPLTDKDSTANARFNTFSSSRPGTSSAANAPAADVSQMHQQSSTHTLTSSRPPLSRHQRPQTAQVSSPRNPTRRQPSKPADSSNSTSGDQPRDSISSNGSWIKRLSLRPLSQHGSIRSSIGPDSPSVTFSHGSAAPILSRPRTAAPPLAPNKLVKRSPSTQGNEPNLHSHKRSKSHLPSLRRPATSHQRSATSQHTRPDIEVASSIATSKYSFDQPVRLETLLGPLPIEPATTSRTTGRWISFFHSRTASVSHNGTPGHLHDTSSHARSNSSKRICLENVEPRTVHLVKPRMVSGSSTSTAQSTEPNIQEEPERFAVETQTTRAAQLTQTKRVAQISQVTQSSQSMQSALAAPAETAPSRRTKRSLSMTFSSAGSWVSRTSGSIRRPKRGNDPHSGDKRHVSDPVTGSPPVLDQDTQDAQDTNAQAGRATAPLTHPTHPTQQGSALGSATLVQRPYHKRNSSSPLPPLSTLLSFQGDFSRLGSSGGAATHPRLNQPSGSSTSSAAMSQLRSPKGERSSTMESVDGDTRGFASGDDDDTDFKSDTMFDSLRTVASGRARAVETPLESVYDESPPGTASNSKTKRLSIQEMLGKTWEKENRIMEEDEAPSVPGRSARHAETDLRSPRDISREARFSLESMASAPPDVPLALRGLGRLSLEDDFDEDWTRDEDAPFNPLSPPSKESSLNSKGMNPNVRLALASLDGNRALEPDNSDTQTERPLSNLFDWSEPSTHDKQDANGRSPRPKTAYAKQEMDSRGGRSAIRKGPTPTHVRSQSVPVVHDVSDEAKPTGAKYGTWGLGTKTVSEDWDEDFEFGAGESANDTKDNENHFAVPESIRATQPSVRAHSGQIRELSLLVNDLKRLCRHGRDMDMLDGPQRGLWKEAEGIIALASPDEDPVDKPESNALVNFEAFDTNERLLDDGFDSASMDKLDAAFDGNELAMSKTAVVRERHSPKRRSVFSPEDDIFGGNWPLADEDVQPNRPSRPRTPESRTTKPQDVSGVVRSVMEAVQQWSIAEPVPETKANNRMHFDTNSLKALVRRAGELRDSLSDIIRRADQITQSPARTPRNERHLESSPAFTRVFDDPGSSPPRRVTKSRGNNSMMDGTSPENSPSSALNGRMRMMMVG